MRRRTESTNSDCSPPTEFELYQSRVNLSDKTVESAWVACEDLDDAFGGIARGYKLLESRRVDDAYDESATLILNLGILSGSDFMTGLRTYFHAFSPLKASVKGQPSAMWSAGSGRFGPKLRDLGIDEILFEGRSESPVLLHLKPGDDGTPQFLFEDASDLAGRRVNDKIQTLHKRFPDAHFAVIGPAGENFRHCRFAAIGLSTENQLKSGDPKARWCGRGGMGGVMGSKGLLAIVADGKPPESAKAPPELKKINMEVAKGPGSARFRDRKKFNGGGGTWANYEALNPVHAMPEMNFNPTGTLVSLPLHRENVETGPYLVKDESCFRCGISCHKNVYDEKPDGKAGKFRAKLDFEPLNLLSSNIGVFDIDAACELVELVDEMGMDSISCGVTLSYAMEYNHRNPETPIAGGLSYGDAKATHDAIIKLGAGELPELGQGTLRLGQQLNASEFAMQAKGVEFPAYLPQTNPGYPWALAGGHMSMKTYLLLLYERETTMDYWVEAITTRGLNILRDDFLGVCKFAGLGDDEMVTAIRALVGLDLTAEQLKDTVVRAFLRGYRLERLQGFTEDDYVMPADVHKEYSSIELPHFNTPEFFNELRGRVTARFEEMLPKYQLSLDDAP